MGREQNGKILSWLSPWFGETSVLERLLGDANAGAGGQDAL